MWKKIAVITGISVAALGAGGAAWAEAATTPASNSGVATASTSASTSASAPAAKAKGHHAAKHHRKDLLERVSHAQWVSKDKAGSFVTHDAVRGLVSSVSPTSITVKAADGTTETYVVNSATKVHAKGDTKAHPGTISQVKVGDEAGVLGTGTTSKTATHIVDRGAPKATTSTAPTTG